jgi:hypothetical protein
LTLVLCLSSLASLALAEDSPPTYHRDVEPIVQQRCQVCHRPGAIGPFDLVSYEDALANSAMIEEVVRTRRMPPWHASRDSGPFSNKRALPDAERQAILDWVEAGAPKGDPAHAPAPVTFPDTKAWQLGDPDLLVETPEPFEVPAQGAVDYQYYEVATGLTEDRWVSHWEIKVDAPEVVHHVLVFVVYPNRGQSPRVRGGLKGYFCSMLPGDSLEPFALGSAKFLPAGARLRFQVHYTPDGEVRTDRVRLALKFAPRGTSPRRARTVALATTRFAIPAGAADHPVRARYTFERDSMLLGLTPHMHLRGKSFSYLLIYPDGSSKRVLEVPRWDFNWQNTYRFAEPLFVPSGSKMVGVATYDNSAKNPANPNPKRTVRFGEQTWDEMMIGYMDTVDALPAERAAWEQGKASPAPKAGDGKKTFYK